MEAGEEDGRWLTYGELAEARGIDRQSARRMAHRARWRRQADNRGVVRVLVPFDRVERPQRPRQPPAVLPAGMSEVLPAGSPVDAPADMPTGMPTDISRAISALEAAVGTLREQLEHERSRADEGNARADRLERDLAAALAVADQARAAAREAQDRAEALGQADTARRARGRWARLRAAWRGE